MEVIDLPVEQEDLYCRCLEDWSDEMTEAGDHKTRWFERMRDKGLRVKMAVDDEGVTGGMIHYVPVERVALEGSDLYYMYCIWVHGHSEGRGNFQKRGMGTALLQAAEEDVRHLGGKGFVVWGMSIPVFMRASWFRKHGYSRVDRDGIRELLWKPFSADAVPPKWIKQQKKPAQIPGKVAVTCFINGWCPVMAMSLERAKRAAAEFGDKVELTVIDTFERDVAAAWGIWDALFIDGKEIPTGPPPSYEKIRKAIAKRVRRLR